MSQSDKQVIQALVTIGIILFFMSFIHPLIVMGLLVLGIAIFSLIYNKLNPEEYEERQRSKRTGKRYTVTAEDYKRLFTSYPSTPGSIIPRDISYQEDQKKLSQFLMMKRDYLSSSVWDKKRKAVLSRDNYTCQYCGTTGLALDVHHRSGYNLIPNEPLSCLVAICRSCHTEEHDLRGYPQTYQEYMTWGVN